MTDIVFGATRRKPAFEYADGALFFVFVSTQLYVRVIFFAFRPSAPLVFFGRVKFCGRIGNEMHRKRKKSWSRKGGFNWTKNDGRRPMDTDHLMRCEAMQQTATISRKMITDVTWCDFINFRYVKRERDIRREY